MLVSESITEVPSVEEVHEGVAVFLTNGPWLCMGQRAEGSYSIPGGAIDPGESPIQAAIREVEEEIGVQLDPISMMSLEPTISRGKHGWIWKTYLFTIEYSGPLHEMEPDKYMKVGWYPKDSLPSPLFEPLATYLSEWPIP